MALELDELRFDVDPVADHLKTPGRQRLAAAAVFNEQQRGVELPLPVALLLGDEDVRDPALRLEAGGDVLQRLDLPGLLLDDPVAVVVAVDVKPKTAGRHNSGDGETNKPDEHADHAVSIHRPQRARAASGCRRSITLASWYVQRECRFAAGAQPPPDHRFASRRPPPRWRRCPSPRPAPHSREKFPRWPPPAVTRRLPPRGRTAGPAAAPPVPGGAWWCWRRPVPRRRNPRPPASPGAPGRGCVC